MHSGHILFEITKRLYHGVENELEAIEESIERIEGDLFTGREHEMVPAISAISKELLLHKRTLGTHRETLESLEHAGVTLFGENFRNYLRGIAALHFRLYNRVISFFDTINELRNTNDSLLTTRQNEIMKNLTIMAFVTFPLTLIAGLFGMNTTHTPVLGMPHDFWVITGTMVVVMISFFAYFKHRKWL
jgi:magnesium transporter